MGRRALPKVDPHLDLSRHFFELEELQPPLPLERLVADPDAPLELEVGSGKGLFLESASGEHPERNFIGIEIARKYARFAASRLVKSERPNSAVIRGDAMRLFEQFVLPDSLVAVHVYFPDPWWKKRHRKRRIMNPTFLTQVRRTLVPGGLLHFWTDVQEYFETTLKLIEEMDQLKGPLPVALQPAGEEMNYRTHFERRMRMHDVDVYRAQFRKPPGVRD